MLNLHLILNLQYLILNLSDSEPIWFKAYLIPKVSGSEPIWFQTYLLPNLSDSGNISFWTFLIRNPCSTEPIRYRTWGLFRDNTSVTVSHKCPPPLLQSWDWPPTSLSVSCGAVGDQTGQPQFPLPLPDHDDRHPFLARTGASSILADKCLPKEILKSIVSDKFNN